MNSHQKNLGPGVGVITMASMLVTLVGLSLLLVVSDARASDSGLPTVPVDSVVRGPQAALVGPVDDARATEMDWQEASHLPAGPAVTQDLASDTALFVYTRNADGILTDPD
jgi:hypothetical protein